MVHGLIADFLTQLSVIPSERNRFFIFFGSTIGNMHREQAAGFLLSLKNIMKKGERLLLGLDLVKETDVLERAYNDELGVTRAFNRNILTAVNRILKTDFREEDFDHLAFYNNDESRIEMHLQAVRDVTIRSEFLEQPLELCRGDSIHTENSHKFRLEEIHEMSGKSGLEVREVFTDPREWFALALLERTG